MRCPLDYFIVTSLEEVITYPPFKDYVESEASVGWFISDRREKQESPDHLVGGLRFSSGMAIETTKPESNMALVSEEAAIVRSPFMQKLQIIRKPKR